MTTDIYTISRLYNTDELAERLNVSKPTVYRLIETREISSYKIKGCLRITEEDVLKYLKKSRIESV